MSASCSWNAMLCEVSSGSPSPPDRGVSDRSWRLLRTTLDSRCTRAKHRPIVRMPTRPRYPSHAVSPGFPQLSNCSSVRSAFGFPMHWAWTKHPSMRAMLSTLLPSPAWQVRRRWRFAGAVPAGNTHHPTTSAPMKYAGHHRYPRS